MFLGGEGLLWSWRGPLHRVLFSVIGFDGLLYELLLFLITAGVMVQEDFYFFFFYIPLLKNTKSRMDRSINT